MEKFSSGIRLSEQQLSLLETCIVDKKTRKVSLSTAQKIYSSKKAAKDGCTSLQGKGILQRDGYGDWVITNLPKELADRWL